MWLYLPISVSSREPGDSTLPSDSLCQRLAVSGMWRSKYRQPRFWQRALRTVPWIRHLSGVTYEPSQADSIVERWLEQFMVFHAPTCQSPESRPASSEALEADCSSTPCESFARLDASGCFLKTSRQSSLFPQDTPYCGNLPKAGSMRNGYLFERPTLALRTNGSESSSWPTARAEDSECCGNHPGALDSLGGATRSWTTPNARDADKWHNRSAEDGRHQNLSGQTHHWKTPHGMAGVGASGKHGGAGGGEFAKQANNWTTPQAHDSGGGSPERVRRKGTEHGCANLADDVTKWTDE